MKIITGSIAICCLWIAPVSGYAAEEKSPEPIVAQPAPAGEEVAPLEIELPEAFFGGTPSEYWVPYLEKETFKPRPPFMAPKGAANLAKGKPVTASAEPSHGELRQLTDGDKDYAKKSLIELPEGLQWMQVDLGAEATLYAVVVWHFHEGKRVYHDIVVQASNDPEFKNEVQTIYNNDQDNTAGLGTGKDLEYFENNQGRLMDAESIKARYVRLYSQGNTANDMNNYIEVEVYGKP